METYSNRNLAEELRNNEDLYRSLFENMLNGFAYCRMIYNQGIPEDFIYLNVNKAFEEQTGLKNVVGKKVSEVIPNIRTSSAELFETYGRVALSGKPETFEIYLPSLDMWFLISVYSPKKEHFVSVFDVITERKKMENKLQHESGMRNILLENLPCIAMILKKESKEIVYSNEAARKVGAVPGQKCYEICAQRDNPCTFCQAQEMWKTGNSQRLEVEYRGKWYEGRWVPLTNDLYVHYIFDISEQKRSEEELRKSNEALKIKTEHAKEMADEAQKANTAKSEFLATMSHELRTPLNSVIGFSELMMMELTGEHKEYAELIYGSGQHLLVLIDDILNLSKIEAEKIDLKTEPYALSKIIEKIEFMMRPFAAEKNLTFEIHTINQLPKYIITDSNRLEQCLVNLINNAIKFTEKGHVYINISSKNRDGKPYISFEVEDTGIGIACEFQEKIFESFVQEDGTMSRQYGGTGLGLTISKKLANVLGGDIKLISEKGKGAIFTLTIPVNIDAAIHIMELAANEI